MLTFENRLRLTIGTGDIPANRTFLTGVPGVNMFNLHSSCFSLVGKVLFKLEEIPFVQILALLFAKPYGLSDSRQFLDCNHSSRIERFYNLLRNNVVDIGSKTVLLLGNLLKVSFSRLCSTGLQSTSDLLVTLRNFFNLATAKDLIFRSNGNLLNPPVDTDNLAGKLRISNISTENNIHKHFVFSDKQISRTSFPRKILLKIFRHKDGDFDSSPDSKKRKFVSFKPNIVTSGIVANRGLFGLWAGGFQFFFQSCLNGLYGFGGFHSSRNGKLRRQIFSCFKIAFVMQRDSVGIAIVPTNLTNKIKSFCVSFNGWFNDFYRNIKFKFYGACQSHIHIINTLNANVKRKNAEASRLKTGVSASLLRKERQ